MCPCKRHDKERRIGGIPPFILILRSSGVVFAVIISDEKIEFENVR
jgi:hypothetical protein